jgi:hypothetical protein
LRKSARVPFLLALLFFLVTPAFSPLRGQGEIPRWQPPKTGLGIDVDLDRPAAERAGPIVSREVASRGAQPLYARLLFSWEKVETQRGTPAFDELEREVDRFRDAGFEVILTPRGGNPLYALPRLPSSAESEGLAAWRAFLRALAARFKGKVRFYQVSDGVDRASAMAQGAGGKEYAFLLKNAAVELRGADPDALIVTGSIDGQNVEFLQGLMQEETAAYLDVLTVRGGDDADLSASVDRAATLLVQHDPSASLWVVAQTLPPAPAAGPPAAPDGTAASEGGEPAAVHNGKPREGALIRDSITALAAGARLITFDLPPDPSGGPELGSLLILLRRLLPPTLGPSPEGTSKLRLRSRPAGEPLDFKAWRFFDASTYQVVLAYLSPPGSTGTADLILDTPDVTGAVVDDLVSVSENPVASLTPDAATRTTRVEVPLSENPLILRYQRFATAGYLKGPDATKIQSEHQITAEEVIARYQEFQADQDARLHSVMATAKISYHYTVASAQFGIDVSTLNNFYWDRSTGAEWEQREFYFNGVRWTGKKPPDLPLIQPEKVVVLPLDIHLNKDYTYRLLGRDKAEGRDCYLLEFVPAAGKERLYRGRVWIDSTIFARVKISSVQSGLEPPVTSNDEQDFYGPAPGSGENPLWVLQRIEGQQRHSLAGVNLIVMREVDFSDFVLNAPDFEAKRRAAYASSHVMMRDTSEGFRYLDRNAAGERVVRTTQTRSTTLGAAGVFHQQNLDYPVIPLVGIDYFSFDFKNTKSQVNLFFAGALLQGSYQDPNVGGTKIDAGVSVFGVAFSVTDKYYVAGEAIDTVDVKERTQEISGNFGYPLGNFFKIKALGSLDYVQYGHAEDAAGSFVNPSDTVELGYGLQGQFDRRGWTVQAQAQEYRRSTWEPWGDRDPASTAVGSLYSEFDPDDATYLRYQARVSKQINLPLFQKIVLRGQYFSGRRLDRFSKYQFGFFGTRVRGFSGTGVRFDKGVTASAGYEFNLGNVVRLGGSVDWGRVRNEDLAAANPDQPADEQFTGVGVSGNFMGPWNTLFQFDYGRAVQSDIPGLAGSQEFEFVLFKFF